MNIDRDASKKLAEAFASQAEEATPREDCPEAEHIYAAVMGELDSQKTSEIVEHTAACPVCAEAWRLARAMPAPETMDKGAPVLAFPQSWRRIAAPLALAASLLLFSILAFQLMDRGPQTGSPEFRNEGKDVVHSLLSENQSLSRESCLLRWDLAEPMEGVRYEVRVTTEDVFQVISTAEDLEQPEFLVAEVRLADLPPGTNLLWWVRVTFPDGRQQRSKTFSNRLE